MINWIKEKLGYKYCYVICYIPQADSWSMQDITTTKPISLHHIAQVKNVLANNNKSVVFKGEDCVIVNIMFLGMSKNG